MDFLKLVYGQRNVIQVLMNGRLPTDMLFYTSSDNWEEIYYH